MIMPLNALNMVMVMVMNIVEIQFENETTWQSVTQAAHSRSRAPAGISY